MRYLQIINPTPKGIHDDFSTNTVGNYTVISGKGLSVVGGKLQYSAAWQTTVAYHTTSLGSADQTVAADVTYFPHSQSSSLLVRFDPTTKTGYESLFESDRLYLNKYNNGVKTFLAFVAGITSGNHHLSVSISGSAITIAVDGKVVLTKADSSYTNGSYVGVRLSAAADPAAITLDNLTAGAL
jgi:hypothetical protein